MKMVILVILIDRRVIKIIDCKKDIYNQIEVFYTK